MNIIHRFIEAWTHSRFERTGVDELLMGLTPFVLILISIVLFQLLVFFNHRYRYFKTRTQPLKEWQCWSDGKIDYTILELHDDYLKYRQSDAFSFTQICSLDEWKHKAETGRFYL